MKDHPSIFTIFGVTGDLAARKIIPALWHLFRHDRLPSRLRVIGFSRSIASADALERIVHASVEACGGGDVANDDFAAFFQLFSHVRGDFDDQTSFESLAEMIRATESEWGVCANKLMYLAAPPATYAAVLKHLAAVGLNLHCSPEIGWTRILVEKPFGTDGESAGRLQALLSAYFKEEQLYRIDHYLFKEIIQGIEHFRFSNNLFEPIWDNTTVERIDIRLHESIGVEGRGRFYDDVGALRDVGQNHLLAMLAAITMDCSSERDTDSIQLARADIIAALAPWSEEKLRTDTHRAQYAGYAEIDGVRPDSQTETYFALKTSITHPRWQGVPIVLEAGKALAESRKEIIVTLKHPRVCLLCEAGLHGSNTITFRLEPNDEIVIRFWTKKPGFDSLLEERTFSFFLYEKETKVQYVEEYAKIIDAAINGNQSLFSGPEEINAQWRFTDPIVAAWARGIVPLAAYEPHTTPAPDLTRATSDEAPVEHVPGTIGIIGLGKMGGNITRQLLSKGWRVTGYNRSSGVFSELEQAGMHVAHSVAGLIAVLPTPRTIWLMVPHAAVDGVLAEILPLLSTGDTVIDGGNSPYEKSMERNKMLTEHGIHFLDAGISGGPSGALHGACVMVGGEREIYERHKDLFESVAVKDGARYVGASGAGHFVKMVHNGIEYGMMQAIAEGFSVLRASPFSLDLTAIAKLYNNGSVIVSRLVGWLANAYGTYGTDLDMISGTVGATGEGLWTVDAAKHLGIQTPIIEKSVRFRDESNRNPSYTGKVLSALRNQFGGHDARSAQLIFVYNADSTMFATMNDFLKKIVAPQTQECNLCKITYGPFSPKEEWSIFLASLPYEKIFLHRDEFRRLYPKKKDMALPSILLKTNDTIAELITAEEINKAKTITDLAILVNKIKHYD